MLTDTSADRSPTQARHRQEQQQSSKRASSRSFHFVASLGVEFESCLGTSTPPETGNLSEHGTGSAFQHREHQACKKVMENKRQRERAKDNKRQRETARDSERQRETARHGLARLRRARVEAIEKKRKKLKSIWRRFFKPVRKR